MGISLDYKKFYVIGHRGNESKDPENTLAAFKTAFHDDADLIEADVQRTEDNGLILFHDRFLNGKTNLSGRVKSNSESELREGLYTYFSDRRESIISVAQLFSWFSLYQANKKSLEFKGIVLELKGRFNRKSIRNLLLLIEKFDLQDSVIIDSFSYRTLKHVRRQDDGVFLSWLYSKFPNRKMENSGKRPLTKILNKMNKIRCMGISFHKSNLLPGLVRFFKENRKYVFGWGIKSAEKYEKFLKIPGLNGFTAGRPDSLAILRKRVKGY